MRSFAAALAVLGFSFLSVLEDAEAATVFDDLTDQQSIGTSGSIGPLTLTASDLVLNRTIRSFISGNGANISGSGVEVENGRVIASRAGVGLATVRFEMEYATVSGGALDLSDFNSIGFTSGGNVASTSELSLFDSFGGEDTVTWSTLSGVQSFSLSSFLVDLSSITRVEFGVGGAATTSSGFVTVNGPIHLEPIESATVPLPAALPLLLAGIGGLGLMSRRRRTVAG